MSDNMISPEKYAALDAFVLKYAKDYFTEAAWPQISHAYLVKNKSLHHTIVDQIDHPGFACDHYNATSVDDFIARATPLFSEKLLVKIRRNLDVWDDNPNLPSADSFVGLFAYGTLIRDISKHVFTRAISCYGRLPEEFREREIAAIASAHKVPWSTSLRASLGAFRPRRIKEKVRNSIRRRLQGWTDL